MSLLPIEVAELPEVSALQDIGRLFYEKNWSLGTSSNYSVVVEREPLRLLMTASGKDKRSLGKKDFLVVNDQGQAIHGDQCRPSAETLLHVAIARRASAACVLHTHSVWSTALSDYFKDDDALLIEGFEMLKGLDGIGTHEAKVRVPILENSQDIKALADTVEAELCKPSHSFQHGFILRRHGLYTWGKTIFDARRHVEIFEFLFEVKARRLSMGGDQVER